MATAKSFGHLLRQYRESEQFSIETFSFLAGLPETIVSAVEMNRLRIPPGSWRAWAQALNMRPETLVALYINFETRKICMENDIYPAFRIIDAEDEVLIGAT
jgi:hypothetical protein